MGKLFFLSKQWFDPTLYDEISASLIIKAEKRKEFLEGFPLDILCSHLLNYILFVVTKNYTLNNIV